MGQEIEVFVVRDAEYRVLDRSLECIFSITRTAPEEPVELTAGRVPVPNKDDRFLAWRKRKRQQ